MTQERTTAVETAPEPSAADLEGMIDGLRRDWTATLTVRRQAPDDIGYREVWVRLDGRKLAMLSYGTVLTEQIEPGRHKLQVDNTLFKKSLEFTAAAGEQVAFTTANRAGWGTYSVWALFVGFLGAGPFYVSLEREAVRSAPPDGTGPA